MQSFNTRLRAWLGTQCQILGNVSAAMLVHVNDGTPQILAKWPSADTVSEPLRAVLTQVLHKQRLHLEQIDEHHYRLGQPLLIDRHFWGAVVLDINVTDKKALASVLKELKVGLFWLQFLVHQQSELSPEPLIAKGLDVPTGVDHQAALLQLGATLLKENSLPEMAISLVNMLASQLGAARASLGLVHKHKLQLEAVSYSAHFDSRTQAMQAVTEAMHEALEQGLAISSPADETLAGVITRAHQQLQQSQQLQWVASFPVRKGDHLLGVITIELDKQTGLTQEQQLFIQTSLHFAGAIIALRQDAGASLKQIIARGIGRRLQRWFGRDAWRGRVGAAMIVLLVVSLFIPVPWRISADASLQTTEKYLVVSPQDGYLGRVLVRPGDSVKKAVLLASLNDEDLLLERRKLASQVQRYRQAYDSALANSDRVEAAIANAQMDQATIQLRLIEQQLQRTQLLAPIDGIIVSNDISQNQGAPVKQGDVLFELAAANDFVVQLFVDERDIAALVPGQQGQVKFTSLPNSIFSVRVKSLTPISEVREGRNYFRVELALLADTATENIASLLRPGMTGTGKVNVGKRALGWIWFHDLWHWLRLSLW
jgi:multidrug resistance efflux pump